MRKAAGIQFSAAGGDLISAHGSEVVWRGRVDGLRVEDALPLPGTDEAIVLLDRDLRPRPVLYQNVLRVGPRGEVRWRAALPTPQDDAADFYVSIHLEGRRAGATSWSGYRVVLDRDTGAALRSTFVK